MTVIGDAQQGFKFELEAGAGLNRKLYLHDQPVSKPGGTVLQFGSVYRFAAGNSARVGIESGLYGQYIYNTGSVDLTTFSSHTMRAVALLSAGYRVTEKVEIHLGATFKNNRDFNDIFVNQAFNFRFDAMLKVQYGISDRFNLTLRYYQSVSKLGDPYFITDPQFGILAGAGFFIEDRKK